MPLPYAAALFDLDGTLLDTEALCNETGVAACRALGAPVDLAFFEGLAGIHDAERSRRIAQATGRPLDPQAFYAEWDRLTFARMEGGVPLKEGARALLTLLAGRELRLALVTSSRREPARVKLRAAGLAHLFACVVTVEDVAHPKPAPDPYLFAAAALGVDPRRCVVFEDSDPGAQAGHEAGCTVVQVPDLHGATGRHAHHLAPGLIEGARMAGLLAP
ncbi:MAG: HAD family phosphatase [Rubellimicrobium sp.]|nr:HAD family phosphatase [Rubellimicrobium sp.]